MGQPPEQRGIVGRVAGAVTHRVAGSIDPDIILEHVDPNALLDRVDVDAFLDRVDVNALLDRVDVDALLDRVDVDRLLARVDLEAAVRRSGVPEIVAQSTNRMAGSALDLARRQIVGLDTIIDRVVDRLLRRHPSAHRSAPRLLLDPATLEAAPSGPRMTVSGHYAGPVSRVAAAALDAAIVLTSFTLGLAGLDFLGRFFLDLPVEPSDYSPMGVALLAAWAWTYTFVSLAIAGRSVGKAVVGLRVVASDGGTLTVGGAFWRTLVFPLSALLAGLGFLLALVQREHRALHDLLARTAVVYDWGERPAELPGPLSAFLSRNAEGA